MDTSDPDIVFDEQGNCNHCNEYYSSIRHKTYDENTSHELLNNLVAEIKRKGKNKKYDCVLGISGGVDSCYTAAILKEKGLKVLAVHLDNGWNTEIAVSNIKKVVDNCGFDYESYVLNWNMFKEVQKAFLKASIVDAEIPTDIAIPAALHSIASKYNVKYIVSGGNYATEAILPKKWGYYAKDLKLFNHVIDNYCTIKLNNYPTFGYLKEMYYKFLRGIKTVYVLNYVPFNKKDALTFLQNSFNWVDYGGKHYESKFTGFLQSYILPVKFNVDYRRATYSNQICTGEITREDALEKLKMKSYNPEKVADEIQYVCKKLEMSETEFNQMMSTPPKYYSDFPNDEKKLDTIYSTYRKLFHKK